MVALVMNSEFSAVLLKSGDITAWESVVNQYQVPLSRYLYNMVKDREVAKDLTQDTFLEAYHALPRTQPDLNLKAWLYRIATNNAIQVLRRRKLISWIPWVDYKAVPGETTDGHEDRLSDREQIHRTLKKIPEKYRAVLLLHDNQGFNCKEIGQTLNISPDAAKKRLARAREMFRDAYRGIQGRGE
ncbi:RNA polymerase sigma factor [Chloroflexota bacterium]